MFVTALAVLEFTGGFNVRDSIGSARVYWETLKWQC